MIQDHLNRKKSSVELTAMFNSESNSISTCTLWTELKGLGLTCCVALRKPLISEANWIKRLHFAWDSGSGGRAGRRVGGSNPAWPRVMVVVSLGKTLYPPCLVWMCMTAVCLRWWSQGLLALNGSHASVSLPQGSCGYYRSLPPPVWLCVNEQHSICH